MLFPEAFHGSGQLLRISSSQISKTADVELLEHLPTLGPDTAHLTEVTVAGCDAIADLAPTAKGALTAIRRQIRRLLPLQIQPQLAQRIRQLLAESSGQTNPIPLESAATPTDHEHLRHRRLLLLLQQQRHQRQRKLMFPRHASTLTSQHRLVGEISPATATAHPPQQRGMGLQGFPSRALPLEPQSNNAIRALGTGRLTAAGLLGQQRHKTTLLIVQHQIAVRRPLPQGRITMTIQPGPAATTQPAPQQPVGENVVGRRGGTHGPTLRLPTAKS